MRLHRLVAILLLLESRKQIKARDLAKALDASERTIYRDIDLLCEAGIPIVAASGPAGGFSLMAGYSVNRRELHGDDIINLYLSGIGVRPSGHSEASLRLAETLARLESSLPPEYLRDVRKARHHFYFDPTPWWKEKPPVIHMDTLRRGVWDGRKLEITYLSASLDRSENSTRIVHPYGLVVKETDWYLVGWCELRAGIRVFRCERIAAVVLLEERFVPVSGFSLPEFWHEWTQQFRAMVRRPRE